MECPDTCELVNGAKASDDFYCVRKWGKAVCAKPIGKIKKSMKTWDEMYGALVCGNGFALCSTNPVNPFPFMPPQAPFPPASPPLPRAPPLGPNKVPIPCIDKRTSEYCTNKVQKDKCSRKGIGGRKGKCAKSCGYAVCY